MVLAPAPIVREVFFAPYPKWKNTYKFKGAGRIFETEGAYCHYPVGSIAYDEFWDEEDDRIRNGYIVDDQRISGLHYLYLNYCPIWNKAKRRFMFPDFRAVDADWFLCLEKDLGLGPYNNDPSRPVGHVDAKSRQVGHSLKAVVPLLYYMNFVKGAKCYIGAIEETYAVKTLKMFLRYHDHLYKNTDLGKGWLEKSKNKYYKTGYVTKVNGVDVEAGYQTELHIVTFQDSTEKGVGGGCDLFVIEEAGLFPDLLDAVSYISDACKDGDNTTGNILVYGAAGRLDNCKDFQKLCSNPTDYGFAGYPNRWEKGKIDQLVAYMVPNYSCRPPYIDEDGNPDCEKAIISRDKLNASLKKKDYKKWAQRMSQEANTIKEMFDLRSTTRFPKEIIEPHLAFLRARQEYIGTRVNLFPDPDGNVKYSLQVEDRQQPIVDYPYENTDKEGCILIYEFPPAMPVSGLYISGIDSYNFDDSGTNSLGCIFIYKQVNSLSGEGGSHRCLVAEYVGRPKAGKPEFYRICLYLLRLYNAKSLYENEDPELSTYFYNKGFDHLLADQPDIIRNIVPGSTTKRTKGIHASEPLIIAAENKIDNYIKEPIGYYYDDKGEPTGQKFGVTRIPSIGLLEELLRYDHADGDNYDRERAFGWLLMYEEELYTKPVQEEYDPKVENFLVNVKTNLARRTRYGSYGNPHGNIQRRIGGSMPGVRMPHSMPSVNSITEET